MNALQHNMGSLDLTTRISPRLPPPETREGSRIDQWSIELPSGREETNERFARCERILSDDEQARAIRLLPKRRKDFVIARGTMRQILGRHLQREPARLAFKTGPQGKLRLTGASIHFNMAHTEGLALLAVSRAHEIGIDLERLRPISEASAIARRFFAAIDATTIAETSPSERADLFLIHWTLREALLKAAGASLGDLSATRPIVFSKATSEEEFTVFFQSRQWWLRTIKPAPGYIGALAIDAPEQTAVSRMWLTNLDDT